MRRSVRDAIVGFSLIGALVAFSGSLLWLRGIRIGSTTWRINAYFSDASGLAERSPVTYRGILVGSVGEIKVSPQSVEAILEIDNHNLRLPLPVFARITNSSLLGGDVQVSLISQGEASKNVTVFPYHPSCPTKEILCDGASIPGEPLANISTMTEALERLLRQSEKDKVVSNLVDSTKQFDQTQKNLDELINQFKSELIRAEPIITNLNKATSHINNILGSLDNPNTLQDLKNITSKTSALSDKAESFGEELENAINDKTLMNALRTITIGLGEFFNELYPSKTAEKS